jgi:hypothetical protein
MRNDDVTQNAMGYERVSAEELARLRGIEVAAREVLRQMQGRRSATPMLAAVATLRAALKGGTPEADEGSSG